MSGSHIKQSGNQRECEHCGAVGSAHETERYVPDDDKGPAGAYAVAHFCPDGSGRRYSSPALGGGA